MHLHNVYFSLKNPSDEAIQQLIDECTTYLTLQDGILSFHCGHLETGLDREVNDRDWDVSLHILFESREAHDAYQTEAKHQVFVERNAESWARVRVLDTVVKSSAD